MKVSLITEGPIDVILLRPLLSSIANRSGVRWPIQVDEDSVVNKIRKTGHGGVVEKFNSILEDIKCGIYPQPDLLVIAIDHKKLGPVIANIKKLKAPFSWMALAVPIQEIEAWWLADQNQTLAWLNLDRNAALEAGYGPDYSPEHDNNPKGTLNRIIDTSDKFDFSYGDGDISLTHDFVESAWNNNVDIDSLLAKCSMGFRSFYREVQPIFTAKSRQR